MSPAPAVTCYTPTVTYAAPAPATVSYYAPPVTTYYAAPTVSYYAAPTVSYYAAPAVVAPAGTVTTTRYGLFGRPRVTTSYSYPAAYVTP